MWSRIPRICVAGYQGIQPVRLASLGRGHCGGASVFLVFICCAVRLCVCQNSDSRLAALVSCKCVLILTSTPSFVGFYNQCGSVYHKHGSVYHKHGSVFSCMVLSPRVTGALLNEEAASLSVCCTFARRFPAFCCSPECCDSLVCAMHLGLISVSQCWL